jgi:hypothetical protein
MASLAELLDYDQRKKQMLDALQTGFNKSYSVADAFTHGLADQVGGVVGLMTTDPRETISNLYQAGKSVVQNPRAAYQAAKEGLTEAVSSPQNIARFAGQNFNPLELANALNKVGTMRELTVYHGTPHTLPPTANNPLGEFDASKIGTGEGAAAYGHGIYVAENPAVAKDYQFMERNWFDTDKATYKGKSIQKWYDDAQRQQDVAHRLNNKAMINDANAKLAFWEDIMTHNHPEKVVNTMKSEEYGWPEASKFAQTIDTSKFKGIPDPGNLYTVDLPDEKIEKMLDWDRPLSEQHESVKASIKNLPEVKELNKRGQNFENLTGQEFYRLISDSRSGKYRDASAGLKEIGIPGIKYFDAGSRDKMAGTRNFVVFPGEEKSLNILSKK